MPTICASRLRASAGSTACEPGSPTSASSSHWIRPRQASSPAMGEPCGTSPTSFFSNSAQRQPARSMVPTSGARAARTSSGQPSTSFSKARAMACNVWADCSGVVGAARPSARASPSALGTKGSPGRTKANSSRTSNSITSGLRPSRPATKPLWATSTSPLSNKGRASRRAMRSVLWPSEGPSARAITAPGGAGTRAIRLERESIGARSCGLSIEKQARSYFSLSPGIMPDKNNHHRIIKTKLLAKNPINAGKMTKPE
jgi:hypothetical protein